MISLKDLNNYNNLEKLYLSSDQVLTVPTKPKTHKVVAGDSLWAIAQKHYGKGSLYPKIKDANKSKILLFSNF